MGSFVELRHLNLRQDIKFDQNRCLEIGALVEPVLHRDDGNVFYADHLSTEDLKKQFAWDRNFDFGQLVDVDYVWNNHVPLKECVDGTFDYVVASHVGEHVPDFIGWIEEIRQILTPSGQLRLVIPDGRYSFDLKRQPSRLSDLLACWLRKAKCPDTAQVLDFALNKIEDPLVNQIHAEYGVHPDPSGLKSQFPLWEALEWGERTLDPDHYEDVHCWVFHLNLFAKLMIPLAQNDIIKMSCIQWYDIDPLTTSYEFTVFMASEADKEKRVASWQQVYEMTKVHNTENQKLYQQYQKLEQDHLQLKQTMEAIYQSTSWRVTKSLRIMKKLFKNK